MDFTRAGLEELGFVGFVMVKCLMNRGGCDIVPKKQGVYVVCRDCLEKPLFRERQGGYGLRELEQNWLNGAYVLNFGKAGGVRYPTANLRKRIGAYIRFGKKGKGGHKGGRAIWQLADADNLLVAWKVLLDTEPIEEEQRLIDEFKGCYGRYPYANMKR